MSCSRFTYSSRRTLGKGAFSTVFLGTETGPDGGVKRRVAVKRIDKEVMQKNAKLRRLLRNEMQFLAQLRHPHIVALLGSFEGPKHMHLVLEYCDGEIRPGAAAHGPDPGAAHPRAALAAGAGNPTHAVAAGGAPGPEAAEHAADDQPEAPQRLRSQAGRLWLCDLAGAADLTQTFCGSPLHMAPELIRGSHNPAVDLWSIGTIAYEMCAGTAPFRAKTLQELRERLRQVRQGSRASPPVPATASDELQDLIARLLKAEPSRRLTFDGFFAHPFFHKQFAGSGAAASTHPAHRQSRSRRP